HAHHHGVLEPGGELVELPHAHRAGAGVQRGEDVQHHALAGEVRAGDGGQVLAHELEGRQGGALRGQLADGGDGIVLEGDGSHDPIIILRGARHNLTPGSLPRRSLARGPAGLGASQSIVSRRRRICSWTSYCAEGHCGSISSSASSSSCCTAIRAYHLRSAGITVQGAPTVEVARSARVCASM